MGKQKEALRNMKPENYVKIISNGRSKNIWGAFFVQKRLGGFSVQGSKAYTIVPKGNHDMENVETWVCAICGRYDPILPVGGEENTTEWIGCDCNRCVIYLLLEDLCSRTTIGGIVGTNVSDPDPYGSVSFWSAGSGSR